MNEKTQALANLIRDLLARIVDDGDEPTVAITRTEEGVDFSVEPTFANVGRLVGKEGCHVKAMKAIAARFVSASDESFGFHILEPRGGEPAKPAANPSGRIVDPAPYVHLLVRALLAIGVKDATIKADPLRNTRLPGFEFMIGVREAQSYRILTVPPPRGRDPLAAIGALGTLFRAAGKKVGVEFELEVYRLT